MSAGTSATESKMKSAAGASCSLDETPLKTPTGNCAAVVRKVHVVYRVAINKDIFRRDVPRAAAHEMMRPSGFNGISPAI